MRSPPDDDASSRAPASMIARVEVLAGHDPTLSLRARAIDAPMSPRPTTCAWRLLGEVITQALGVSKVHVSKFAAGPGGVDVHQDPDAHRHRAGHVDLTGAEQRYVAEADAARTVAGKVDVRSCVVVKIMLTTSSWASSLRSIIARRSSCVASSIASGGVRVTGGGAAKPPELRRSHVGIVEAMASLIPTASIRRRTSAKRKLSRGARATAWRLGSDRCACAPVG